jgi:hypothetical protein
LDLPDGQAAFAGTAGATIIDGDETGGSVGYGYGIRNDGKIWWWPSAGNDKYSTSAITMNAWTYVALTYDGTNVKMYANDTLDSTQASSPPQTPTFLKVGAKSWVTGAFKGGIATVSMYSAALTVAQIQQNCKASVARFTGGVCH